MTNATPASLKTTGEEDPTPSYIADVRDAAFDAIDSADEDETECLVQLSSALTKPYDQHAIKAAERLGKKDKTIEEKLAVMLKMQKFK